LERVKRESQKLIEAIKEGFVAIAFRSGDETERATALAAIRGFVEAIVLTPYEGKLRIEVRGNLAAMLGTSKNEKVARRRPLRAGADGCSGFERKLAIF